MIKAKELLDIPKYKKFLAKTETGETVRAEREDDTVFVFAKGRRRYGYRMSNECFCRAYSMPKNKLTENQKWQKRVRTVIKGLEENDLFPDLLEKYRNLLNMSLEDKKEISRIYWELPFGTMQKKTPEDAQKIVDEYFGEYVSKYPFIFTGSGNINTFYFWEMSEATLKTMYFGYRNKEEKENIRYALDTRQPYKTRANTSYDVSFSYDPEKKKAVYAEEYKGCGNGHYYLAINSSQALFCEND